MRERGGAQPRSGPGEDRRLRGYLLAALAAACWAAGGLTAKWLFSPLDAVTAGWPVPPLGVEVAPTALASARALAAFLIALGYLASARRRDLRVRPRDLLFLAAFGVVLALVHFTYFQTISLTDVATAILLEYLAPVLVLVLSVLFLGERFTWSLPVGVALSVSGCALVVGALGGAGLVVSPAGIAWGLASAFFFGMYSLLGRVAATRFRPWTLLVYGLGAASVFWMAALGGPKSTFAVMADPATLAAVTFLAIVSTLVPFGAFLKALHYIDPTRATVTATLEPAIAGVAAFALFGEALSVTQMLGALLVLAAIGVVQAPALRAAEELPPVP